MFLRVFIGLSNAACLGKQYPKALKAQLIKLVTTSLIAFM